MNKLIAAMAFIACPVFADPAACIQKIEASYQKCIETGSTIELCQSVRDVELKKCRKSLKNK